MSASATASVSVKSNPYSISFETDRLTIRNYQDSDFENSLAIYGDPENTTYFDHGKPRSREEVQRLTQEIGHKFFDQSKPFGLFSLFLKRADGSKDFIGHIDMMPRSEDNKEVEIGYIIDRKFQRNGFATEAMKALIQNLIPYLNHMGGYEIKEVMATSHPENTASRALLEKLGLTYERLEDRFGASRVWYRLRLEE